MSLLNYTEFIINESSIISKFDEYRRTPFTLNKSNSKIKPFLDLAIAAGADPNEKYNTTDYDETAPVITYGRGAQKITIIDSKGKKFTLSSGKTEIEILAFSLKSEKSTAGPMDAAKYEQGIVYYYNINQEGLDIDEAIQKGSLDSSIESWIDVIQKTCEPVADSLPRGLGILVHSGKTAGSINSNWNGGDKTAKADLYSMKSNGGHFSVKKKGGAQLMSSTAEAKSVFNAGLAYYEKYEKTSPLVDDKFIADLSKKISYVIKTPEGIGKVKQSGQNAWLNYRLPTVINQISKGNLTLSSAYQKNPSKPATSQAIAKAAEMHVKAEYAQAGIGDRKGNWEANLINGISDGNKEFTSWWENLYLPLFAKEQRKEVLQHVLDATQDHRDIQEKLRTTFTKDPAFLKWLIYEAATGQVKFTGIPDLGNTSNIAVANQFIIFDNSGLDTLEDITINWAEDNVKNVKTTVGFKSSGGRSASSIRLSIGEILDESVIADSCDTMESIIEREFNMFSKELLSINESFTSFFTNAASKAKTFVNQTWDMLVSAINSFYDKVIKKITDGIIAACGKSIQAISDFFGFSIEGECNPISISF